MLPAPEMGQWRGRYCMGDRGSSTIDRRAFLTSAVLVPLALTLGGCGSTKKFRYKVTVEVETPQGVRSGYAVREIVLRRPPNVPMLGADRGSTSVRGEAVAVDIAPGKTLFVLLRGRHGDVDYAGTGMMAIFRVMDRASGRKGGPHELWPHVPTIREPITDPLPMLVSFLDPTDPKSVEPVNPHDLAATFGPGYRLKSLTVRLTDAPVTSGIEGRLPSFGKETGFDEWYRTLRHGDPRQVTRDDFVKG